MGIVDEKTVGLSISILLAAKLGTSAFSRRTLSATESLSFVVLFFKIVLACLENFGWTLTTLLNTSQKSNCASYQKTLDQKEREQIGSQIYTKVDGERDRVTKFSWELFIKLFYWEFSIHFSRWGSREFPSKFISGSF